MRMPFVACLFAVGALAQASPVARGYLPDDHHNVMFVDFVRLRDSGVMDELESSVLKAVFPQFERQMGFPLRHVDRIVAAATSPTGEKVSMDGVRQAFVMEGNAPLGTLAEGEHEQVGDHRVAVLPRNGGEWAALVTPKLRVWGSPELLEPPLRGQLQRGLPAPDVQSLLSGRGDNLAGIVLHVGAPALRKEFLTKLLPGVTWPEGEAPTFLLARLRAIGEPDDPHLEIEVVLRHDRAGDGLEASAKAATEWVAAQRRDPRLQAVKAVLGNVQQRRDRGDLVLALDLGRVRAAIGHLAVLVAPLVMPPETKPAEERPPVGPDSPAAPVPRERKKP